MCISCYSESLRLSKNIKHELNEEFIEPSELLEEVTTDDARTELHVKLISVVSDSMDLYEQKDALKTNM